MSIYLVHLLNTDKYKLVILDDQWQIAAMRLTHLSL